jgi:hypothetical protein
MQSRHSPFGEVAKLNRSATVAYLEWQGPFWLHEDNAKVCERRSELFRFSREC